MPVASTDVTTGAGSELDRFAAAGLIGRVHVQVLVGALSPAAARAVVTEAYASTQPTFDEVENAVDVATEFAASAGLRTADFVDLLRLSLKSVEITDRRRRASETLTADVALRSLITFPDGRVYRKAVAAANAVLEDARKRGEDVAAALHRAAQLRVFAYTGNYRTLTWWNEPMRWQAEALRFLGPGDHSDAIMPAPLPELEDGMRLLSEATDLSAGARRSLVLYELAAVEQMLALDGHPSHTQAAVTHAEAAWDAAGPDIPAHHAASLCHLLARAGAATPDKLEHLERLLDDPQARMGAGATSWAGLTINGLETALLAGDHELAARFGARLVQLAPEVESTQLAAQAVQRAVHALDGGAVACAEAQLCAASLPDLLAIAHRAKGTGRVLAARLHAASHAADLRIADNVLSALSEAEQKSWVAVIRQVRLDAVVRELYSDPAATMQRPIAEVAQQTVEMLRLATGLRQLVHVDQAVNLLAAIAVSDVTAGPVILAAVAPFVDRLLDALGETAYSYVQRLGNAVRRALVHGGATPNDVLRHSQLFKAPQFTAIVRHAGPHALPPEWGELLTAVRDLEAALPDEPVVYSGLDLFDLAAFAVPNDAEQPLGLTARDRLTNLQRRIDHEQTDTLHRTRTATNIAQFAERTGTDATPAERTIPIEVIAGELDVRTVLLDWYAYDEPDGHVSIHVAGATSRGCSSTFIRLAAPARSTLYSDPQQSGRNLELPAWADPIVATRALIQDDPGFRTVTREAAEMMAGSPIRYLGRFLATFRELGCDRICLWPHGALHFAPMQLMRVGDALLADDWTVTQISTPASLEPNPVKPADRPVLVSASAANGGQWAGLPRVPELDELSRTIAGTVPGARVLTDATQETLHEALLGSDWLHISAHGAAKPLAPSFQCLYLGDGSTDERLFATSVQAMDLRGISLVTLAGCETALGRVDRIDNMRGLTAALMTAGVGAIVAPLWPVRPASAALFFGTFYAALAAGGASVDPRDAFREAQLRTRSTFPALRDWGAYVYEGRWK